jgi:mono/diheme cytochrome c family protein
MTSRRDARRVLGIGLCGLLLGCRRGMEDQPKVRTLQASDFFPDGRSERPRVRGTVARGHAHEDELLETGMLGGKEADLFPFPVGAGELARGRRRFDVFCAPCHGRAGDGDGMVVRRGFPRPPSFHDPRLRAAPAGHFVAVAAGGFGRMYAFSDRVPARDRWEIAAYIRALQLSREARLSDASPSERAALERSR